MTTTTTPTVRFKTSAQQGQFLAFVRTEDDTEEVRVRFERLPLKGSRNYQWTCDVDGRHLFATCAHEKVALAAWRARKAEADD